MSKFNLFEDKEYENMEWLNKAVEPFIFPQNEVLMAMPDKVELDYKTLFSFLEKNPGSLRVELTDCLLHAANSVGLELSQEDIQFISDNFKLEVASNTIFDFEDQVMTGAVTLVKTKHQYEDEDIVNYAASKVSNLLRYVNADKSEISRMNEIMDLIGAKETRQSRSTRYKMDDIAKTMHTIISEDRWRVRNVALLIKCASWIKAYIEDGNLAAMSNFTRLKCMVHKGAPIYSMEEAR